MGDTEVIVRPNGKPYRPRKVVVEPWDNESVGWGYDFGVVVLGTHDIALATSLANDEIRSRWDRRLAAVEACVGWYRDGFQGGDRCWVNDDVRGRAGVWFRATEPESTPPSPVQEGEPTDA